MPQTQHPQAENLKKYVQDLKALVVDPSSTSRIAIAKALTSMGLKTAQITLTSSYPSAETEIERIKPNLVVADYDLGKHCGLELLQKIRAASPDFKKSLFILVTGNTSQSAVARAAEEDVDSFVIKPFTMGVLRSSLVRATLAKLDPPEYVKVIERGKSELQEGKTDEAIKTFEYSRTLDPAPALACFYGGQSHEKKTQADVASTDYLKGLSYNKIHYKCLVGLYENLMSRKKHADAYDVIKRISHYFPANPQRLTAVLRLAIVTKSYEDVERYYRTFKGIDERNEDMIRYVCAALVVCGRYYLQTGFSTRALELFQKAAVTASGRTRILREIVHALLDFGLNKEAEGYLGRFPPTTFDSLDYKVSQFLVINQTASRSITIDRGRALIAAGVHDAHIYQALIQRSKEAGLLAAAEDLQREAIQRFPEQKSLFEGGASAPNPKTPA